MNASNMQNLVNTNPDTTVQVPATNTKKRSSDLRLAVTELLQAKPLTRNEIRTALDIQPGTSEAARLESTLSNFKRAGLTLCKEGKLHLQDVIKAVKTKGPKAKAKKAGATKEAPAEEASNTAASEATEATTTTEEAPAAAPEEAATVNTAATVAEEPVEAEVVPEVSSEPEVVPEVVGTTPTTTTEESLANHISVVLGGGQMTFDEVFTALANRGWLPNSTNPRAFVYHTLNKVQQSFAKNPSCGVTRYLAVG
jgi:hypothetical protein